MNIQAEEIMRLHVNIEKELEVGEHPEGFLRVNPITGGTFTGKMFNGIILPGGADWNTQIKPDYTHVHAKYCIKENDGTIISVDNEGYINFTEERRIRTIPRFTVSSCDAKYQVFLTGVFVGELDASMSEQGKIEIIIYKLE